MLDRRFWSQYFRVYDELNQCTSYQDLMTALINELDAKPGDIILDAGSGTGNLSTRLSQCSADIISMDFVPYALERHREKDPNALTVLASLIERLPFPDNSFDKIVSNNVLYTIPPQQRDGVVLEFKRILKPEGIIVVSNISTSFSMFAIYSDNFKNTLKRLGLFKGLCAISSQTYASLQLVKFNRKVLQESSSGDYAFFEPNEQKDLLAKHGFNCNDEVLSYANTALMLRAQLEAE